MSKFSIKPKSQQSGFTLIELVVVIVILGIMAATALPKFADIGSDARKAKMNAAAAAMKGAMNIAYSTCVSKGQQQTASGCSVSFNGATAIAMTYGYPSLTQIEDVAGLADQYDYNATTGVLTPDTDHTTNCTVTYAAATSATSPATVTTVTSGC